MKCMWYLYIIARQQNFRLCYVRKWKESFYLNNLVFIFVGNPNWSETNILFCLRPEAGIHKHARSWNGAPRPEWTERSRGRNEESGKAKETSARWVIRIMNSSYLAALLNDEQRRGRREWRIERRPFVPGWGAPLTAAPVWVMKWNANATARIHLTAKRHTSRPE